jgi:hypothetical protein
MQRRLIAAIIAAGALAGILGGLVVLLGPGIAAGIRETWARSRAEAEAAEAERRYPHLRAGDRFVVRPHGEPGISPWHVYRVETPTDGEAVTAPIAVTVVADDEQDMWRTPGSAGTRDVVVRIDGREGRWLVSRRALARPD